MSDLLIYTFRTNRYLKSLRSQSRSIFVFGSLKKDLPDFQSFILNKKPKTILGLAAVNEQTRIERMAVNSFGQKKIIQAGKECFELSIPTGTKLNIAKNSTNSFCNWTAYNIAKFLEDQKLHLKHSFIHFNPLDIDEIMHSFDPRLSASKTHEF